MLALARLSFFGGRRRFVGGAPRSISLLVAGRVAVAYLLLHLFTELSVWVVTSS
ncbi:hypothetical protein GCM10023185_33570 [Hymenobacter saemangeumensis]|uniref:Uncharacterized protein n=1 Tax=Hymenobacter saemangeumensis TaxID=1084522 RepID=A0ABP8INF0_9BACT